MSVSYGYENQAKGGRYLPLRFRIDSNGPEDFAGELSVLAAESDGEVYEYTYPLTVPSGTAEERSYHIPLGSEAYDIRARIRDEQGKELWSQDIGLNIDAETAHLFIGTLCDHFEHLNWLQNVPVDYNLFRTRLFEFDESSFPSEVTGLDLLDVLIVTDYRFRKLSEEQTRALLDWVRGGGVLVIGTGDRAEDTLGRFAPELLDNMYEEAEIAEVLFPFGEADDPNEQMLELPCIGMQLKGGSTLLLSDGLGLIQRVQKDNGAIVVTAFDLVGLKDYARTRFYFADSLLSLMLGQERLNQLAREAYGTDDSTYQDLLSLLNTSDIRHFPPLSLYAFAVGAYILLAGPGLYLFLSQRDASEYYRRGVIMIAVVFACVIYIMGSSTRFRGVFYNYAFIRRTDGSTVSEEAYLNLRTPYNRPFDVHAGSGYAIRPLTSRSARQGRNTLRNDGSVLISFGRERTGIHVENAGAFAPRLFEFSRSGTAGNQTGVSGELRVFEGQLHGTLTNHFPYDLENVTVLTYGHMFRIGPLEAGESITLEGMMAVNIPPGSSLETARAVTGAEGIEKAGLVKFYSSQYLSGYYPDARILAFSGLDEAEGTLVLDELTHSGVEMDVCEADLDPARDGLVCRAVNMRPPEVLSGQYEAGTNAMFTEEPLVLEYALGYDLEPERLLVEWPDSRFGTFDGSMYLYNCVTGSYELADPKKTVYSREDLADYISPARTVTIRYIYAGRSSDRWETVLPLLFITGREV